MNTLQIFENSDFGQIRTLEQDGQTWFVGKDVATALGYERADNAIRNHVDEEDKLMHQISASGQNRSMTVINESGLYSLVLSSKLPTAKQFKRWITNEVLPSIRKSGGYIVGQNTLTPEQLMAQALMVAQKTLAERDNQISALKAENKVMAQKAIFADAVSSSDSTILVGELAKLLRQNGVDMGEKRLFQWLREKGYLIRRQGADHNMPTQRSVELELFKIKESSVCHSDGHITVNKTPKVTGKGQAYFINLFLKKSQTA